MCARLQKWPPNGLHCKTENPPDQGPEALGPQASWRQRVFNVLERRAGGLLGVDLGSRAEVFLFDEPISGLSSKDSEHVAETLRSLEEALLDFPGSAIVILAATLSAVPAIPAIGLVLVLSVDWFMGIARALGNLIGNCVATVVVAAWEGDIDRDTAHAVLDGRQQPVLD